MKTFTDEERYLSAEILEFLTHLGIVKEAQKNPTVIGALATKLHGTLEQYGYELVKKKA